MTGAKTALRRCAVLTRPARSQSLAITGATGIKSPLPRSGHVRRLVSDTNVRTYPEINLIHGVRSWDVRTTSYAATGAETDNRGVEA